MVFVGGVKVGFEGGEDILNRGNQFGLQLVGYPVDFFGRPVLHLCHVQPVLGIIICQGLLVAVHQRVFQNLVVQVAYLYGIEQAFQKGLGHIRDEGLGVLEKFQRVRLLEGAVGDDHVLQEVLDDLGIGQHRAKFDVQTVLEFLHQPHRIVNDGRLPPSLVPRR